jgi:signal transduction histidine kinase
VAAALNPCDRDIDPSEVEILLVDDQPSRLLTYEAILSSLGHRLVKANSGVEALQRLMEGRFAVILLDVSMPDMNGFETAQMIHQHPRFESTPIIFVTGVHTSELDRLRGYEVGAVDYVYVPVVPEILRGKVAVLVELHCQRLELRRLNDSLLEANQRLDAANRELEREKASELAELNGRLQEANRELQASNAALTVEITERRRAEQALLEADRRNDDFLAILAHELRNPLAPMSNAIQILQRIGPQNPELRKLREMIDRQVRHMKRLVDDLLDVSRITQGKITLQSEPLELGALVQRAVESNMSVVDAHGHHIEVSVPAEPVQVRGDPVRLAQVVSNLVNNAAKFTPNGGRIEVSLTVADRRARISVRDNGIGIEAQYLPHVFELFGQVRNPRPHSHDGLGIGLALVQRLVEMHRGRVEARSGKAGAGSEFVVELPLLAGEPAAAEPAATPAGNRELSGRRILVVDDFEDCRESLARVLEFAGAEARTAPDGQAALEVAASFEPDVVIMDIRMPVMDGYEAARRLRAGPRGGELVLIALTGWGQPEHVEKSRLAGFNAHATKPLEIDDLLKQIAELTTPGRESKSVASVA